MVILYMNRKERCPHRIIESCTFNCSDNEASLSSISGAREANHFKGQFERQFKGQFQRG